MGYDLDSRLVIGVASSALFSLGEANDVFETLGEAEYRRYQEERLNDPLEPGMAFPFVKRLLSLNDLADSTEDPLVEVIVLSHNDPDTGLRVMKSIAHHGLGITRAVFTQGQAPFAYIPAFNISLFLSGNGDDVRSAIGAGHPAGQVLESHLVDDPDDNQLRIAFDFDGVLADDGSERVMQEQGLEAFHEHESKNMQTPHTPGPLKEFLTKVTTIQNREEQRKKDDPGYKNRLRVCLVTARNAPSHERAVLTLKDWGVTVNDAFFLGGVSKGKVLEVLRPHIFFEDQKKHLDDTLAYSPAVHIPFGLLNTNGE